MTWWIVGVVGYIVWVWFGLRFFGSDDVEASPNSNTLPIKSDEPLIGFRQWRLFEMKDGTLRLTSSIRPFTYDGPVVTTSVEDVQSGHGLHAAKDGDKFYDPAPQYPVEGEVELFGRVVEGRRGYRAERLKIRSLTLYPGGWSDRLGQWSNGMIQTRRVPNDSVRQFASSELTETPWPHPFKSLAKRLEKRYRCDVKIGERDGSPILDADSSSGPNLQPNWNRFWFTEKPTDDEIAQFGGHSGELWTPREPDNNKFTYDELEELRKKMMTQSQRLRRGGFMVPTGTPKRSFDIGA